jgi:hypothetical protein
VYDLAAERVVPVIAGMAAEYEKKLAQGRLEAHFGGPERFAAIARQVKAWGQRHLPPALFETLSATPDGIAALHHMMRAGEPRFIAGDAPAQGPTQDELDTLVRDPRYWRDHQRALLFLGDATSFFSSTSWRAKPSIIRAKLTCSKTIESS